MGFKISSLHYFIQFYEMIIKCSKDINKSGAEILLMCNVYVLNKWQKVASCYHGLACGTLQHKL